MLLRLGDKERYLDLLEKLIFGKFDSFKFYIEFNDSILKLFDSLKANFPLITKGKLEEFSDFICEIMGSCYSYYEIFE